MLPLFAAVVLLAVLLFVVVEIKSKSSLWPRLIAGIIVIIFTAFTCVFITYQYYEYIGVATIQIFKTVRMKLDDEPSEKVKAFLDERIPQIEQRRHSVSGMHSMIVDIDLSDLRSRQKAEQDAAANP